MSKSPEDRFVEAMRVFTVSKEYDDEFTDEMKTLLRTLAVAFAEASGHDKTELLVDCGLEDTP